MYTFSSLLQSRSFHHKQIFIKAPSSLYEWKIFYNKIKYKNTNKILESELVE